MTAIFSPLFSLKPTHRVGYRQPKPLTAIVVAVTVGVLCLATAPAQASSMGLNGLNALSPLKGTKTGQSVETMMMGGWAAHWSSSLKPLTQYLLDNQLHHFAQPFLNQPYDTPSSPNNRWGEKVRRPDRESFDAQSRQTFTSAPLVQEDWTTSPTHMSR